MLSSLTWVYASLGAALNATYNATCSAILAASPLQPNHLHPTAVPSAVLVPLSIPSPPNPVALSLGPFTVRWYALWIITGMAVAIFWTSKRWARRGGESELPLDVGIWVCLWGVVGARVMAVLSYPEQYFGSGIPWWQAFAIWEGGLAIYGGLIFGAATMVFLIHRRGLPVLPFLDAAAPTVLVAQAFGRLGNYFNQEVFGSPTTLPWGLEIANANLPSGYAPGTLFHPTFLYEILWNLLACGVILLYEKRGKFFAGELSAAYFALYSLGRFGLEFLRIDYQNTVFGSIRWFQLVAALVFVAALAAWLYFRRRAQSWCLAQSDKFALEENPS